VEQQEIVMASAASSWSSTLEELQHAPLQLPEFVNRAASPQQLVLLAEVVNVERSILRSFLALLEGENDFFSLLAQASNTQEVMAALPVAAPELLLRLQLMRQVRDMMRRHRNKLQQDGARAFQFTQAMLGDVHTVFALPEVERTTDLLPELVGLIGNFFSPGDESALYVSIYALPKPSQRSATGVAVDSFSSTFPARELQAAGSGPAEETKEDKPSNAQEDKDE
jgi:hypothetical protein